MNQTTQELQGTLQSQVSDTLDLFRKHRESLQEELRLSFDRLSSESIGMHAERLETASDSWMLRSVRQLNEHGRTVMDSLAKSSEMAVRNSFQMIFEGMARTLRDSRQKRFERGGAARAGRPGSILSRNGKTRLELELSPAAPFAVDLRVPSAVPLLLRSLLRIILHHAATVGNIIIAWPARSSPRGAWQERLPDRFRPGQSSSYSIALGRALTKESAINW